MKTRTLTTWVALIGFTGSLLALTPVQEAKNHLEHAIGLLNKREEGAGRKRKTSIPNILSVIASTEERLTEVKKNKGTNVNVALEYLATARTELEAAKSGAEAEHMEKAEAALHEALQRVIKMIQINKTQ